MSFVSWRNRLYGFLFSLTFSPPLPEKHTNFKMLLRMESSRPSANMYLFPVNADDKSTDSFQVMCTLPYGFDDVNSYIHIALLDEHMGVIFTKTLDNVFIESSRRAPSMEV